MGLRDDAARWAADEARKLQDEAAAKAAVDAAAAAAPLWHPDWHQELVHELQTQRFPQLPVFDWIRHKYRRTGLRVWVIQAIGPDTDPHSSASARGYHLGVDEKALYKLDSNTSVIYGAAPYVESDADGANSEWYPIVVALVGSLTTNQRAPHITVLRSMRDWFSVR